MTFRVTSICEGGRGRRNGGGDCGGEPDGPQFLDVNRVVRRPPTSGPPSHSQDERSRKVGGTRHLGILVWLTEPGPRLVPSFDSGGGVVPTRDMVGGTPTFRRRNPIVFPSGVKGVVSHFVTPSRRVTHNLRLIRYLRCLPNW